MKKRNLLNKMLALAMSLCMIFTMMPMAAHATETTHTHVWSETWSTNITDHWHECTADGCTFIPNEADINKGNYGTHNYVNYECTVCGYDCPHSLGLDYDANNHWQRCSVEGCGYTTDIQGHDEAGEGGACSVCYYDPNNLYHEHYWTQEWTNNTTHHWHVCNGTGGADCNPADSDPEDSGYAEHSYSNDADTLCDTCGYTRTIEHTHSYTAVVTEPTCGERGYTTYTCSCNDSYVSDYVDALDHDWGDYESDGNGYHTRTCTTDSNHYQTEKCGGGTATCKDLAICSDCGVNYGSLNSTNHTGGTEVLNKKEATETEDGYTGDTYCLGCGYKLSEGDTIPATGSGDDDDDTHTHNYSYYKYDGTNHWKMCHCGQGQAGSVKPHTLVIQSNNNGHWKECTVCNYYSDIQAHVYSNDSDANCNDCGYERHVHSFPTATCITPAVCSCGSTYEGKNPNNHAGGTEIRNAAEATIVAEGYTGDTYCLGCGSMIASGEVIPKAGVIFDGPGVEDVTFIPAAGTELPGDAELVVEPHTPSADNLDFVLGIDADIEYLDLDDERIIMYDTGMFSITYEGVTYKMGEYIIIDGLVYFISGVISHSHSLHLIRTDNKSDYILELGSDNLINNRDERQFDVPTNKKVSINGITYDVKCIFNTSGVNDDERVQWMLYHCGEPVGTYFPGQSIAVFYEGYDPETLKAQQNANDLGTVTPGENPIDGLVSGKTYNVSVIGSQDISVSGYDEAVLNSIKAETEEEKAAKEEVERLKTDMEAKKAALDQVDATDPEHMKAWAAWDEAETAYKEALAELAALANLQSATVTQTFDIPNELVGRTDVTFVAVHNPNPFPVPGSSIRDDIADFIEEWHKQWEETYGSEIGTVEVSEDGQTLTATYTVSSFSPFTVYAFVEADEPEIKTLSATIVDGSDDTTEAPDTNEPVVSPQTSDSWIWYVLIAVVAGAIAVASVVYGKRRKSKAN